MKMKEDLFNNIRLELNFSIIDNVLVSNSVIRARSNYRQFIGVFFMQLRISDTIWFYHHYDLYEYILIGQQSIFKRRIRRVLFSRLKGLVHSCIGLTAYALSMIECLESKSIFAGYSGRYSPKCRKPFFLFGNHFSNPFFSYGNFFESPLSIP